MEDKDLLISLNEKIVNFIAKVDKILDDHECRIRQLEKDSFENRQVFIDMKQDVKHLKDKSTLWNLGNSIAAGIAALFSTMMK